MTKERLLAYTDAIIAIIITIMVLEFKVPHAAEWSALYELRYVFISYIMSFVFLSIYWNNHHHGFQVVEKINGNTLWANNALIFSLSLVPFVTAWMAENHFERNTVIAYGSVLTLCAISYTLIFRNLITLHGPNSKIAKAIEKDKKGKVSLALYILGTLISFWFPVVGLICFTIVSIIWIIPDPRIERTHTLSE